MRPALPTIAALLVFSCAGLARAQLAPPDLVGSWTLQFSNSFNQPQQCTVNLTGDVALWGKLAAKSSGCDMEMMSLAGWEASGNRLTLTDMSGNAIGTFTRDRRNWSGTINRDKSALLFRHNQGNVHGQSAGIVPPGSAVGRTNADRCVFYGYRNQQCASANDLRAPQTPFGQSVTVRMLGNNPVFSARSARSAVLGRIPLNSCVQASDCQPADANGEEWCQVSFNGLHGYSRKIGYDGQHRYLNFSNTCRN